MTTMLEKAARAVWERREAELEPRLRMTWEAGTDLAKARVVADVRVALLAIREPDPSLGNAGGRLAGDYTAEWSAMIDAILNEKPEP